MSTDPKELTRAAAEYAASALSVPTIDIALVLGSGWSSGVDELGETIGELELELGTCPASPSPSSPGTVAGCSPCAPNPVKIAAVFTGRTHYYEGRGTDPVAHGVRTAAAWGASTMVLTNGCGGLHPDWAPGTSVLISDHINLTGDSPLHGATFVDLTEAYFKRLRDLAHTVDPDLQEDVYVQFRGPHYETPAEVRMASIMGGDLVGMSTTLETIAAREAGMEVLGISLVTNAAAGLGDADLSHAEVLEAGKAAGPRLAALLSGIITSL